MTIKELKKLNKSQIEDIIEENLKKENLKEEGYNYKKICSLSLILERMNKAVQTRSRTDREKAFGRYTYRKANKETVLKMIETHTMEFGSL